MLGGSPLLVRAAIQAAKDALSADNLDEHHVTLCVPQPVWASLWLSFPFPPLLFPSSLTSSSLCSMYCIQSSVVGSRGGHYVCLLRPLTHDSFRR